MKGAAVTGSGSAEQDASRRDDLFRLLVARVVDYAIFLLDPEGRVQSWNEGAQRIKGYEAGEIIGRHFSIFYPPEDVAAGKPARLLEQAASEGRVEDEGWRVRKGAARFWADVVITALRDERGRLVGFAKVTRDLTERREAEEAERARLAAERAVREREAFISVAAHELRTPLAALFGLTELLLRRVERAENLDPETMRRALEELAWQAEKLRSLGDQLLDATRIEGGHLALERRDTDLAALAREVTSAMQAHAEMHHLVVDAPPALRAWVDPLRVEQVLTNLLTNAIRYSPGGGEIRVAVEEDPSSRAVRIVVEDRGIGVPKEHRARIFERFYRAHTADYRSGLGLGLYISREIATLHGGRLEMEARPEGGSRFVATLPSAPTAEPASVGSREGP